MVDVNPDPARQELDEAWQNITGLRFRLISSVNFYQHTYRAKPWLIIADQQNESYFRCSAHAEQFLRLLDGSRTVEQALLETQQDQPSDLQRKDIVLLIANLKTAGLLEQESIGAENGNTQPGALKPKSNPWLRPFAIKIALFDPDRFLDKTMPYFRPLFDRFVFIFWLVLVLIALTSAVLHWPQLLEHGEARFADPKNLLWYWLLYPLLKALHEFGHAYATKVWGGAVHEMGIMLLVFFPVPYVDSSAAHRFDAKNRRLLVTAAGILVEVFFASLALLVWVNIEPGFWRDIAFDIFIIGGVSTLLFNANPLLRFDGYYILSEFIEIPNLGTRSTQYLGYLFKRYVLDIANVSSPVTGKGEKKWLVIYGIGSAIYRVFISLFIAFWVASKFLIIGILLAIWAIATQIIYPALKNFYQLIPQVRMARRLNRFVLVLSVFFMLVLTILVIPVGHSTYSEGIVSMPENSLIRAGTDGIITGVLLADGSTVEQDVAILIMENIELVTKRDIVLARLQEAQARQNEVLLEDRTQAENLKAKVSSIEAELKDLQAQLKSLRVTSQTRGIVSLPMASDLPGRFVQRGEVIGYVAGSGQLSARVVIPQLQFDQVRRNTRSIEARLRSRPDKTLDAAFLRELPQATNRLPSRLLGSSAGGEVAVDARDQDGVQAMSNIFQLEIELPLSISGNYLGQRVLVRFIHQRESLANQLRRRLNHFLLQAPFV